MMSETANVLFVEDCDSDFEMACAAVGQSAGAVRVNRVSSGNELLQFISKAKQQIDLFVLDLCLPDTSGLELAKSLREQPNCKAKPIVIFSSSTNPDDIAQAKLCGANEYRIKPIVPDEYLRVVGDIVQSWLPKRDSTIL